MFICFCIIVGLLYYISRLQISIDEDMVSKDEKLHQCQISLIRIIRQNINIQYDLFHASKLAKEQSEEMYYDPNNDTIVFIPDLIKAEDL
jgi:hypothetical protein